ncbi:hypothetical protein FXO37_24282 [Capsicum annuum]|nr:hypothetical protein FXO37_24282 [Capsicum annuum]
MTEEDLRAIIVPTLSCCIDHRVEIRIQFHHVPGNLYHKDGGHVQDLSTNELILRDVPDEAILIRINKKLTGLSINLEASALNLLFLNLMELSEFLTVSESTVSYSLESEELSRFFY